MPRVAALTPAQPAAPLPGGDEQGKQVPPAPAAEAVPAGAGDKAAAVSKATSPDKAAAASKATSPDKVADITMETDASAGLKDAELKDILKTLGLSTRGNREQLLARIQTAQATTPPPRRAPAASSTGKSSASKGTKRPKAVSGEAQAAVSKKAKTGTAPAEFQVSVEEETEALFSSYFADNSALQADSQGIVYRASKDTNDRVAEKHVKWGDKVWGVDEKDGWLKVGVFYLPMHSDFKTVLRLETAVWRYEPQDGLEMSTRVRPRMDSLETGQIVESGDTFEVSQHIINDDGITCLRLADGKGWLFEEMPGRGPICMRFQEGEEEDGESAPKKPRNAILGERMWIGCLRPEGDTSFDGSFEPSPIETGLLDKVLNSLNWRDGCTRALVKNLMSLKAATVEELPKEPRDMQNTQFIELQRRFEAAIEKPLQVLEDYATHRRVLVGTTDFMLGHCGQEASRRLFDFVETTGTWQDTNDASRIAGLKQFGCSKKDPSYYKSLAAAGKDRHKFVVKVSCFATELMQLRDFRDWWPKLYKEKYAKLKPAAFLWQLPPKFVYTAINQKRLEDLADYLASPDADCGKKRHIVDFRDGSWYRNEVYELLRQKRWCLAWLHINNQHGWASNVPSGWTDRVQTTNFCFMRLFGPDGPSQGAYSSTFLREEIYEHCPAGATTYVLFGNRETLSDSNPWPIPSASNAVSLRSLATNLNLAHVLKRIRDTGESPRPLDQKEALLVNLYFMRFSAAARKALVCTNTPVCVQQLQKYDWGQGEDARCFEWYFPATAGCAERRLHLNVREEVKQHDDLGIQLRQLHGLEDLNYIRQWAKQAIRRTSQGKDIKSLGREMSALLSGMFVRYSSSAREDGLGATSELQTVTVDGWQWKQPTGDMIWVYTEDLDIREDLMAWLLDIRGLDVTLLPELAKEKDRGKDESLWNARAGEMWQRQPKSNSWGNDWGSWKQASSTSSWQEKENQQSWQKPQESWEKPKDSWEKPEESWGKPKESWQKPQDSWQKPQDSWQTPKDSWQEPQKSWQKPQESWQKPKETWHEHKDTWQEPQESWPANSSSWEPGAAWSSSGGKASQDGFAGQWQKGTISEDCTSYTDVDGSKYPLKVDGQKIVLHTEDEIVCGTLNGQTIVWSDGDVWKRA